MALSALVLAAAFALQPPGVHHGDETVTRDGERWLALRADGRVARLDTVAVRVQAVEDVVLDGPGDRTGRDVSVAGAAPIVLLRGPGLRLGTVPSSGVDAARALRDRPIDLALSSRRYRLALACAPSPGTPTQRCEVVLTGDGRRQALFAIEATPQRDGGLVLGDDASPALWFAGDLDRDGRLDLLLDTTDHYNVGRPTLFPSGAARAGELVRPVTVHQSTGC